MNPREYEMLVCEHYRNQGYQVEPQRGTGDWGVDLFASRGSEKVAVQVKMYGATARPVNRAMVMELEGARRYFDCTSAAVVTDGRVLADAHKVADKLGIPIEKLDASGALPSPTAAEPLHFEQIWSEWIVPLAGKTLTNRRGDNQIIEVDWSGIRRISSAGKPSFLPIEVFRSAVNHLLEAGSIRREEINDLHVGRASSAICLILSQVPLFSLEGKLSALKFNRDAAAGFSTFPKQPDPLPKFEQPKIRNQPPFEIERSQAARPAKETADVSAAEESALSGKSAELSAVAQEALQALAPPGRRLDDPQLKAEDGPGLYAIYGSAEVWEQLGLGTPPDNRPLYVGKAEESLINRDVKQHFGTGATGSSTVRRSLAAFLREPLALRAQPRNPKKPDHFANYSVQKDGDQRLTEWMHQNLRLALWVRSGDHELRVIESALLQHWQPPLNGQGVKTPWSAELTAARKSMANEARAWAQGGQSS